MTYNTSICIRKKFRCAVANDLASFSRSDQEVRRGFEEIEGMLAVDLLRRCRLRPEVSRQC